MLHKCDASHEFARRRGPRGRGCGARGTEDRLEGRPASCRRSKAAEVGGLVPLVDAGPAQAALRRGRALAATRAQALRNTRFGALAKPFAVALAADFGIGVCHGNRPPSV